MPGPRRGQYLYAGAGLSEIGALPTYAEARHLASNKDDLRQRASNDVKSRVILLLYLHMPFAIYISHDGD